jgi:hypothetical protein
MTVEPDEIALFLRMGSQKPHGALAERIRSVLESAEGVIRPARTWRRFEITDGAIASGILRLDGSRTLSRHLEGCHAAYLVCGTLGPGFDALQRTLSVTSASDALILQATGAAMIEKLMDSAEEDIHRELAGDESLTSRYSPGYGDFPLEAQRTILNLLEAHKKTGVSLTDTLLMVPSKSVSAVVGVCRRQTST